MWESLMLVREPNAREWPSQQQLDLAKYIEDNLRATWSFVSDEQTPRTVGYMGEVTALHDSERLNLQQKERQARRRQTNESSRPYVQRAPRAHDIL